MSRHIDLRPYKAEIEQLQQSNSDTAIFAFVLRIISIMKQDSEMFRFLHHALTEYVKGDSRMGAIMNWGFHAQNFFSGIRNLEQNVNDMAQEGVIGGANQATKQQMMDFLRQAKAILTTAQK